MNPQIEGQAYSGRYTVETSQIFTKPEYADMIAARERQKERRRIEVEQQERRQYEQLATKFRDRS